MDYHVDDITGVGRPRQRLLVRILAVVLPVLAFAAGTAWFIRAYVLPPSVAIAAGEPVPMSTVTAVEPQPVETTGTAQQDDTSPWPQQPAVRYSSNSAEIWASVPLPGPPRTVAPEPELEPAVAPVVEPATEPVPLPPRRPRVSAANADDGVPLPRPRPASN